MLVFSLLFVVSLFWQRYSDAHKMYKMTNTRVTCFLVLLLVLVLFLLPPLPLPLPPLLLGLRRRLDGLWGSDGCIVYTASALIPPHRIHNSQDPSPKTKKTHRVLLPPLLLEGGVVVGDAALGALADPTPRVEEVLGPLRHGLREE